MRESMKQETKCVFLTIFLWPLSCNLPFHVLSEGVKAWTSAELCNFDLHHGICLFCTSCDSQRCSLHRQQSRDFLVYVKLNSHLETGSPVTVCHCGQNTQILFLLLIKYTFLLSKMCISFSENGVGRSISLSKFYCHCSHLQKCVTSCSDTKIILKWDSVLAWNLIPAKCTVNLWIVRKSMFIFIECRITVKNCKTV